MLGLLISMYDFAHMTMLIVTATMTHRVQLQGICCYFSGFESVSVDFENTSGTL